MTTPRKRSNVAKAAVLDDDTIALLRRHRETKAFIANTRANAQQAIANLNAQLGQAALEQLDIEEALRARAVDLLAEIPDEPTAD